MDSERQADAIRNGNVREAARLISAIENRTGSEREVLPRLYRSCGSAHLVGVTGPPGAGKSTLVGALIQEYRRRAVTVGVIAVDPSSPFTGGALLGDRDRMVDSALDPGVFIRSVAARGEPGGLASAVNDAVDVMDAMGKDVVIVETVGVGQGELSIAEIAHTVLLTLVPGYGDVMQAMKAGILEIADIIAVNKSDMPGADKAARELESQDLAHHTEDGSVAWVVPVILVSARRNDGIGNLVDQIETQRAFAAEHGWIEDRVRRRRQRRLADLVRRRIEEDLLAELTGTETYLEWGGRLEAGDVDPLTAADAIVTELREHLLKLDRASIIATT